MLVLSVTDCPPALRGDLSRWLLEIDTGVYVGKASQRVREELWKRVVKHLKNGRAVLVYNARNEQKMDFRVHNASWEPIDFDGLKLMLRPSIARQTAKYEASRLPSRGYSMAAKMRMAKRAGRAKPAASSLPERFVIMDLETTGLHSQTHEIIEIGAIKMIKGEETACFHSLIKAKKSVPGPVAHLTGLTHEILQKKGGLLEDVLPGFIAFLEDMPIVAHNIAFDLDFLRVACDQIGLLFPGNRRIDTLSLAQQLVKGIENYKLETLLRHFNLPCSSLHRSLPDCRATLLLLSKLIEIRDKSG